MFLYCRNCRWQQDDYWSDSYNPIKSLKDWESNLFVEDLDGKFHKEMGNATWREVISDSIFSAVKSILSMKYRTRDEYKENNPDGICPWCSEKALCEN